jgi:phosphohistidine phosphatase
MRRLMLLRHAKTKNDAPSGRDQDRRLDNRGRNDAAEIGGWIGRHPPFPDSVLVSPAIRAHQTWQIAWEAMKDLVPEPQVELAAPAYHPRRIRRRSTAANAGRA